jgi:hypothetical protein
MLNKEYLNELFEYKNGDLYWKNHIYKAWNGKKAGSLNNKGYWVVCINWKRYQIHRLIFLMHNGIFHNLIDHIDGNKLNNKIENLREATNSQNLFNSKKSKTNSSGIKNVHLDKKTGKWMVRLQINKKRKTFGLYFDKEVARFMAETMRHKYHKEFANHGN